MTGTVREYLYAGGEAPTAMRARQADGTYKNFFFVTNTHGDVVALTDRDGNIVNRYAYGPWGEATRVSEAVHQPFRYAGYFYEPTADLYWLRARWYDAGTGRFLSRDPLRGNPKNLRSLNRYIYGGCAPPTMIDPGGMSPRCAGGNGSLENTHARNMMTANIAHARAARGLASRVPLELILNTIYTEGREKWWKRIGGEQQYERTENPGANVGVMNVSGGQAEQVGYPWRRGYSPGLMDPAYNVLVGTQYLNHRYWQGIGAGALESVGGNYDAFYTLIWQNYVTWDKPEGEWDAAGILSQSGARDFCARLATIRSEFGSS